MFKFYQNAQVEKKSLVQKLKALHTAKNQRGMTLLEIIIVLGIVGTIAAGVVVLAQRAFDSRAISEVVNNTNTLRVAMKDAYQRAPGYPVSKGTSGDYDIVSIKDATNSTEAIARLVQLGKVTTDEALNGISNDFINIGAGKTAANQGAEPGTGETPAKGKSGYKEFVVELNGLNQEQCRSILIQVGNLWDYAAVGASAPSGVYTVKTVVDMTVAPTGPVLRSLGTNGNVDLTPDAVAAVCVDAPTNSVILGTR
ncbi:prepilin-type N-terminal cleavage/methylation domain-containing protein [Providencia manganoxydans]